MGDDTLTAIHNELLSQTKTLARLEANMESLVGNGQPGRIDKLEDNVDSLQASKNYLWGFGAGLIFIEGAFHYLMHKAGLK